MVYRLSRGAYHGIQQGDPILQPVRLHKKRVENGRWAADQKAFRSDTEVYFLPDSGRSHKKHCNRRIALYRCGSDHGKQRTWGRNVRVGADAGFKHTDKYVDAALVTGGIQHAFRIHKGFLCYQRTWMRKSSGEQWDIWQAEHRIPQCQLHLQGHDRMRDTKPERYAPTGRKNRRCRRKRKRKNHLHQTVVGDLWLWWGRNTDKRRTGEGHCKAEEFNIRHFSGLCEVPHLY